MSESVEPRAAGPEAAIPSRRKPRSLAWKVRWPDLDVAQILGWADAHHARTGEWPTSSSGPVAEAPREKWGALDQTLRRGLRGLEPGLTLAQLLAQQRGKRNPRDLPRLTEARILEWADAHHARAGRWPTHDSGSIPDAPGETWTAIEVALSHGHRGLAGGSSLAKLLVTQRDARIRKNLPPLTEAQILAWADAYYERTGEWPGQDSGPVAEAPAERWRGVDRALLRGERGLAPGSSLARLLSIERGVRNPAALSLLTIEQLLAWADRHHERTGTWPRRGSGPVVDAPGEKWSAVERCLHEGLRGLPYGLSLARLLAEQRGARNRAGLPELSEAQILAWASAHFARHGRWPQVRSGPIEDAPGETWSGIQSALQGGLRGLPGGSSLARLLAAHREASHQRRSRKSKG